MRLRVGAATSIGRVRPINEDAYLANPTRDCSSSATAWAAPRPAKWPASWRWTPLPPRLNGTGDGDLDDTASDFHAAHRPARRGHQGGEPRDHRSARTATTRMPAWGPRWSACGSTPAWSASPTSATAAPTSPTPPGSRALTSDHSLVEAQVQAGLIDREQSLKSEHQNILLRALGRDPNVEVDLAEVPVAAGDRLLLCSDGLTRMVPDDQLAAALERFRGDPQGACDHLVEAANANGGPDNITVRGRRVPGIEVEQGARNTSTVSRASPTDRRSGVRGGSMPKLTSEVRRARIAGMRGRHASRSPSAGCPTT